MTTLIERVRAYARSRDVEILIVDGPNTGYCLVARAGPLTTLVIDSGTAASSGYGELVYHACERAAASDRLKINVHHAVRRKLAS